MQLLSWLWDRPLTFSLPILHYVKGRDRAKDHGDHDDNTPESAQDAQPIRPRFLSRPTPPVPALGLHLPRRIPPLVDVLVTTRVRPLGDRLGRGDETTSDRDGLFVSTPYGRVLWRASSRSPAALVADVRERNDLGHLVWRSFEEGWRDERDGQSGLGETR